MCLQHSPPHPRGCWVAGLLRAFPTVVTSRSVDLSPGGTTPEQSSCCDCPPCKIPSHSCIQLLLPGRESGTIRKRERLVAIPPNTEGHKDPILLKDLFEGTQLSLENLNYMFGSFQILQHLVYSVKTWRHTVGKIPFQMPLKVRQDLSGKGITVFGSVQTLDIGQHELLFFCPYWKTHLPS